jgi:S1-C subfamily serine protease
VLPAVVGIRTQIPMNRLSAGSLGQERWGSGVVIDPAGHVLTVGYIILDAERIDVFLRDGRTRPARLVANDFESGIGVVKLEGEGPWPWAPLGDSKSVTVGQSTGILGVDEARQVIATQGTVKEIRGFAGNWEYMLERAIIVEPHNPAFGGSPLLNAAGEVIGISSLRLGDRPYLSLAIPIELFSPVREELLAKGRVTSRRPRPWIGVTSVPVEGGVGVARLSRSGPAMDAGLRAGDVIVRLNGEKVDSLESFDQRLWERTAGEEITLVVIRESGFEAIKVKTADRRDFYRTRDR